MNTVIEVLHRLIKIDFKIYCSQTVYIFISTMTNRFGGNKHKKYKKGSSNEKKEDTPYKNGDMIYAQVKSRLGGKRISVVCDDKVERQAIIPGSMYKRQWLNEGDILLVQTSEILGGDCSVVYKYNESEIRKLKSENALNFKKINIDPSADIQFADSDVIDSDEDVFDKIDKDTSDLSFDNL